MEALFVIPFILLLLAGSSLATMADVTDETEDEVEPSEDEILAQLEEEVTQTVQEAEENGNIIFDDTRDADNGVLPGTDAGELFFGSLEANGPEGIDTDVTNPNDTIDAQGGNDTVFGGNGEDQIGGGDGDDVLSGGPDNDTVIGGLGDDTVAGDAGSNVLTGGDGNDVFIVIDDEENDTITDFSNEEGNRDFIDLTAHFDLVEQARAAYDPETGRMQITSEFIQFQPGITDAFTAQTTGLADNQAPIAQNDTAVFQIQTEGQDVFSFDPRVEFSFMQSNIGGDSDPDGIDAPDELSIVALAGNAVGPGDTVTLPNGVDLSVRTDDGAIDVDIGDAGLSFFAPQGSQFPQTAFSFSYQVADSFGAVSQEATALVVIQQLNLNQS